MSNTVLFLCSGNYYRSRFAELVFNHLAKCAGLDWRATSRALVLELGACNVGPISDHTRAAVAALGNSAGRTGTRSDSVAPLPTCRRPTA